MTTILIFLFNYNYKIIIFILDYWCLIRRVIQCVES